MGWISVPVGRAWTVDPGSGKGVPLTSLELAALLTASNVSTLSAPGFSLASIWPFQDATGSILDANGLNDLVARGSGSTACLWQQAIPGWSRLGAGHVYNTSDTGFVKQHGTLPDPHSTSSIQFGYVILTASPTVDAGITSVTDGAIYGAVKSGTLYPAIGSSAGQSSVGGHALPIGSVFPYAMQFDNTNQQTRFYTPYEVIARSYAQASVATAEMDLAGVALASTLFAATANYPYGFALFSASAEVQVSDVGSIWSELGWNVLWHGAPAKDSTSGKYWPLDPSQWTSLGISAPMCCWGLQETSGILANDYCGNVTLVATDANFSKISAGAAVSGWSRTGFQFTDTFATQSLASTSTRLPTVSGSSQALAVLLKVNSAANGVSPFYSWVAGVGSAEAISIHVGVSGVFGFDMGSNTHHNGQTSQTGSDVLAFLVYDKTNTKVILYTDAEIVSGTYNALSTVNQGIYFGAHSAGVPAAGMQIMGGAYWTGSYAELTAPQVRSYYSKLGRSPQW